MDRRDDMMRHFPTLLGRWNGGGARLMSLTYSHQTLTILLTRGDRKGCLEVACVGPERIEAPCFWNDSLIEIEKAPELFDVIDTTANVRISGCHVSLHEYDKEPWER